MPSLNWIGKESVTNHDKEVPFRLLKKIKTASVGEDSQNLIIHGDNLEGLKALMPHYINRVDCVYTQSLDSILEKLNLKKEIVPSK